MEDAKQSRLTEENCNAIQNRNGGQYKITRSGALSSGRESANSSNANEETFESLLDEQGNYKQSYKDEEFNEMTKGLERYANASPGKFGGLASYLQRHRIEGSQRDFESNDAEDFDDREADGDVFDNSDEGQGADRTEVESPTVGPSSRRVGTKRFAYKQRVFCNQLNKTAIVLEDDGGPEITVKAQNGQIYAFNREDCSTVQGSFTQDKMIDANPGQDQSGLDDDAYPTPKKKERDNYTSNENDEDETSLSAFSSKSSYSERRRQRKG